MCAAHIGQEPFQHTLVQLEERAGEFQDATVEALFHDAAGKFFQLGIPVQDVMLQKRTLELEVLAQRLVVAGRIRLHGAVGHHGHELAHE